MKKSNWPVQEVEAQEFGINLIFRDTERDALNHLLAAHQKKVEQIAWCSLIGMLLIIGGVICNMVKFKSDFIEVAWRIGMVLVVFERVVNAFWRLDWTNDFLSLEEENERFIYIKNAEKAFEEVREYTTAVKAKRVLLCGDYAVVVRIVERALMKD